MRVSFKLLRTDSGFEPERFTCSHQAAHMWGQGYKQNLPLKGHHPEKQTLGQGLWVDWCLVVIRTFTGRGGAVVEAGDACKASRNRHHVRPKPIGIMIVFARRFPGNG